MSGLYCNNDNYFTWCFHCKHTLLPGLLKRVKIHDHVHETTQKHKDVNRLIRFFDVNCRGRVIPDDDWTFDDFEWDLATAMTQHTTRNSNLFTFYVHKLTAKYPELPNEFCRVAIQTGTLPAYKEYIYRHNMYEYIPEKPKLMEKWYDIEN